MTWQAEYTERFKEDLDDRRFSPFKRRIEEKCRLLLQAPYSAAGSERLKYHLAGKRSARVDPKVRIIFTICEECQRQGLFPEFNQCCDNPEARNPQTVLFLYLSSHYRQ